MGKEVQQEVCRTSGKDSTLAILRVLQRYSGEGHQLLQKDIIAKMKQDYGITVDRKTVGRTIKMLQEFRFRSRQQEFDIVCDGRKGTYLRGNNTEVKIQLRSAIVAGKRVRFVQFVRNLEGKEVPNDKKEHPNGVFMVDPYEIVSSMGHDYLVCHKVGDGFFLRNLRLDRIRDVEIMKIDRMPLRSMEGYEKGNWINRDEYERKLNYHMFSGSPEQVEFRIEAGPQEELERRVNTLWSELATFEDVSMRKQEDGSVKVSVRMPLAGARAFAYQFADLCTLIWPENLAMELKESFAKIEERYNKA